MIDQASLELPDRRRIARPSETVIRDARRTLWVERRIEGDVAWYPWTHVKPHVGRILEMLKTSIEHRFQGDPSG